MTSTGFRRLTADEAIPLLADWTEACEGCQRELDASGVVVGHGEHGPRRRRVHSMAGPFGAHWDYADVLDVLRREDAEIVMATPSIGHPLRVRFNDGDRLRVVAFECIEPQP